MHTSSPVRNKRFVILILAGLAALALAPFLPLVAPQAGAESGVRVKIGGKRIEASDTMGLFSDFLSGPGFLQAEGLDPRTRERPALNTLTGRQGQAALSGFNAPSQQGGGGLLVPFRDPAPAFSRNILITRDFSDSPVQLEPHMAVDPLDPDHLVVGVIDFNFPSITAYTTFDGGENWEGPSQLPFIRDDLIGGGDPVVGFDRDGRVFIAFLSIGIDEFNVGRFSSVAQISAIAVSVSDDGGLNWKDPVSAAREIVVTDLDPPDASLRVRGQVNVPFLDKPWMHIGPHPDDHSRDVIYVSYTEFVNVLEVVYIDELPAFATVEVQTTIKLVKSEDLGRTWTEPISISPTVRRSSGDAPGPGQGVAVGLKRVVQGSEPRVAPDGTVYVSWMDTTDDDSQEGLGEIYIARSNDAGESFTDPIKVTIFREPGFRPRSAFFRYWGSAFPKLEVGPEGNVYVVYVGLNASKDEDDGDVYFVKSTDKGQSWSRPSVLGGDRTSRLQFFPAIAVDPSGDLHVMWGDMRDDPVQIKYHIYYTTSEDQGESWGFELKELNLKTEDTRVTDFASNANRGFPNGLFLGDYFAIDATDEEVYMVWADTRLGEFGGFNQKVGFARKRAIPSSEVFISPPTGPGGQEVVVQGFNLQPDLNVFVQVGRVTVASERINKEGRFTTRLFMPVTGEGAQEVRIVDESGNVAATSYFTEFGFGNIQEAQERLAQQIEALSEDSDMTSVLQGQIEELRQLIESSDDDDGGGTAWWVIFVSTLGGAALAAAAAVAVAYGMQGKRRSTGS